MESEYLVNQEGFRVAVAQSHHSHTVEWPGSPRDPLKQGAKLPENHGFGIFPPWVQ